MCGSSDRTILEASGRCCAEILHVPHIRFLEVGAWHMYNFLVEELGAIPADCVEHAPEEGWPNISEGSLAGMEKTKKAVDILRHLSYIKYSNGFNVQIAFATEALDYRGAEVAVGNRSR
ncbi:hypothetical protein V2A60_010377 [Cordyceps javanica]